MPSAEILAPTDIQGLERAIVASVAPQRVVEIAGWLVPLDDGSIGRAKSAAPLTHAADPDAIADIEQIYQAARLPPAFRLAEVPGLSAVRDALLARGYAPHTPTIMKLGTAAGLAALSEEPAELMDAPDAAWIAAFTGEGFDPQEGAQRARNLTRAPDVRFAAIRQGERTVAVGVGSFNGGWVGVHGMRTAPEARRRGHASRILAAIGAAALARGLERAALQVKEDNPARSLYRAAGFSSAWRYQYWAKP
ncbi:GNAT family N-acetyltransferase [Phenylobacterium sp.]|uniref:GNAT family N-acetyltransferase n=1 Tax=Phenylobacterium sp. TaxID=1871053 RepID=UPI002DEDCE98|nr:GNAT family N-acetyltransferase [Phenylobacterium sp.]